jgi:hypothetical protein
MMLVIMEIRQKIAPRFVPSSIFQSIKHSEIMLEIDDERKEEKREECMEHTQIESTTHTQHFLFAPLSACVICDGGNFSRSRFIRMPLHLFLRSLAPL